MQFDTTIKGRGDNPEVVKMIVTLQNDLAREYNYKPLTPNLFCDLRKLYEDNLPSWCNVDGDPSRRLLTSRGAVIASGYKRIVIGDYGAFVEITPDQINKNLLRCKPGEEFRIKDPRYKDMVKYHWYIPADGSRMKIYFQMKPVCYADYVPGMYYISPYELKGD